MSIEGWRNKLWYKTKMECYSDLEKKEILIHTTTWINLDDIMLNEISQPQKDIV